MQTQRIRSFVFVSLLSSLSLIQVMALPSCGTPDTPSPAPAEQAYSLHADGRWIRDGLGRVVILRGINTGSRSKLPPFLPFEDTGYLDQLADWGMNSIRLVFTWEGVEPEEGIYDDNYLNKIRAILDGCAQRGIMAILDSHQDLYARNFCGDGFPAWTVPAKYRDETCPEPTRMWSTKYLLSPGVIRSFHGFWESEELQDAYSRMIVHVAQRLGSHPAVVGIDLLNEPYDVSYLRFNGSFERDLLTPFYKKLMAAVREYLPETLLIYGTTGLYSIGLPTYLEPLGVPNIAFGAHWYSPLGLLSASSSDIEGMRRRLEKMLEMTSTWQVPVWIGEYGVTTSTGKNVSFLSGQIDLLDEFLVGSALWTYNPTDVDWNMEGTSLVYPGGVEKPHVSALVRPYPARIAGVPTAFRFDLATGAFDLTFKAETNVSGPTEILIPPRIYPAGFQVEAQDGTWEWDTGRNILIYNTPGDGAIHTLRLRPVS